MKKLIKKILLAIAIILIFGLLLLGYSFLPAPIDISKYDRSADINGIAQTKIDTTKLPNVTLSIIKTAKRISPQAFVYQGGNWLVDHEVAHIAVMVRHPQGNFLFDTGLGLKAAEQFAGNSALDKQLFSYQMIKPAVTQLQEQGIDINSIKTIILSHIHWDHASGVEDFPDTEVMVTKTEYDFGLKASRPAVIREQFDDANIKWRFLEFNNQAYENFDRSFDLFGDGSIVLVPLTGHTPGSTGMFVNLASGKRFFFIGDLSWAKEGFEQPTQRPWLARSIVDNNANQVRDMLVKVYTLKEKHPELIIVPAHDARVHNQIAQFPKFE